MAESRSSSSLLEAVQREVDRSVLRARNGIRHVYGATVDLRIDRHGQYIAFGEEETEFIGIPDLDTWSPVGWDPQVARVVVDTTGDELRPKTDVDEWQRAIDATLRDREAAFRRAAEWRELLRARHTWRASVASLLSDLSQQPIAQSR